MGLDGPVLHSFHLAELPARRTTRVLVRPPRDVPGLRHAEGLALMRLGAPTVSPERLQLRRLAVVAAWEDEAALEQFLAEDPRGRDLAGGWHVRLQYLRRFGEVAALAPLPERAGDWDPDEPVVAVTLARLRLPELPRFLSWGKPVERLVAEHPGVVFATAAVRPPRTFSTFSTWRSVRAMTSMVHGRGSGPAPAGSAHRVAMGKQRRRDFHHESTFLRFRALSEHGSWRGRESLLG